MKMLKPKIFSSFAEMEADELKSNAISYDLELAQKSYAFFRTMADKLVLSEIISLSSKKSSRKEK